MNKECPIHHKKETRQVPSEDKYKGLEKWVCDRCGIAWYVQSGKSTGNIFGQFNTEMRAIVIDNAKKAYLPHKPKPTKSMGLVGRRRYPGPEKR